MSPELTAGHETLLFKDPTDSVPVLSVMNHLSKSPLNVYSCKNVPPYHGNSESFMECGPKVAPELQDIRA